MIFKRQVQPQGREQPMCTMIIQLETLWLSILAIYVCQAPFKQSLSILSVC